MSRHYALDSGRGFNPRLHSQARTRLAGPLSNEQKAALCILAREAWEKNGCNGDLDTYRHTQVEHACGKPGLTACSQDDYLPIRARFRDLIGQSDRAFQDLMQHGTEDVRVAQFKLHEALKKAGLPIAYAATICRRQYRCGIESATAKQLWQLTYTINNRAASRRRASK